jgi:hypothetical protein
LRHFRTGGRLGDREADGLEHAPDKSPEAVVIVDDQDRRSWLHGIQSGAAPGRRNRGKP